MTRFDLHTPLVVLQNYLESTGFLDGAMERILSIEKPGEGNMNVVLRVKTGHRSFILKQSRPYVQKYQQIEAPLERIAVEYEFYRAVQEGSTINDHLPDILTYAPGDYLLLMEDLGQVEDMTQIYHSRIIDPAVLDKLLSIVSHIHGASPSVDYPLNTELRRLNHQHIFVLPFIEDNGFPLDDLQTGLLALSIPFKKDKVLKKEIDAIGNKYLSKGIVLIHGDYYPGSWMTVDGHVYVIDPEFSFMGFAEFDLGVMAAHCIMASMQPSGLQKIMDGYSHQADGRLAGQVAGIEIIRRLIGIAQLPLERTLEEKEYLLQIARKLVLE